MTTDFVPQTEFEQKLLDAQEGRLSSDLFMRDLLDAQLFMPVLERHRIAGFQDSPKAHPLTLEGENGRQILILFTSPERARHFLTQHPGYEGGLLAEFRWILEQVGYGIGISLNPNELIGMEIEANTVEHLRGIGKAGDHQ